MILILLTQNGLFKKGLPMTKQLILLRGAMGAGKSTFIKDNNLEPYTLSADDVRNHFASPIHTDNGRPTINNQFESDVWSFIKEQLNTRMSRGEFIVVDATHAKQSAITEYKKLVDKYKYRVNTIEFKVPLETLLERNTKRPKFKQVPTLAIENAYVRMTTEYVPKWSNPIEPQDFKKILWRSESLKEKGYDQALIIGDIHGSATALKELLNNYAATRNITETNPLALDPKTYYIFLGDYLDRGAEIVETFRVLQYLQTQPNVSMLYGNHESKTLTNYESELRMLEKLNLPSTYRAKETETALKELWKELDAKTKKVTSMEQLFKDNFKELSFAQYTKLLDYEGQIRFQEETRTQFEAEGITRNEISNFLSSLRQCIVLENENGTTMHLTHGGLATPEENLSFYSSTELINGTGDYSTDIDSIWEGNAKPSQLQAHGHRNLFHYGTKASSNSYNLEGGVENGGTLRAISFDINGHVTPFEVTNVVVNERNQTHNFVTGKDIPTPAEFLNVAQSKEYDKLIQIKPQGEHILAINFTEKAFKSQKWDGISSHARGLFLSHKDGDISVIARSYNKFFNTNQVHETRVSHLEQHLVFPVRAYEKSNGLLGLIGWDEINNKPFISSKGTIADQTINGPASWVKDTFLTVYGEDTLQALAHVAKQENVTFVFEVIAPGKDEHIVKYYEPKMVLLDAISNEMQFKKFKYSLLNSIAKDLKLEIKKQSAIFQNWQEYFTWFNHLDKNFDDTAFIEGWVLEDSRGGSDDRFDIEPFMWKLKGTWYSEWKWLRGSVKHLVQKPSHNGNIKNKSPFVSMKLYRPIFNRFAQYLQENVTYKDVQYRNTTRAVPYLVITAGNKIRINESAMASLIDAFYKESESK